MRGGGGERLRLLTTDHSRRPPPYSLLLTCLPHHHFSSLALFFIPHHSLTHQHSFPPLPLPFFLTLFYYSQALPHPRQLHSSHTQTPSLPNHSSLLPTHFLTPHNSLSPHPLSLIFHTLNSTYFLVTPIYSLILHLLSFISPSTLPHTPPPPHSLHLTPHSFSFMTPAHSFLRYRPFPL